MSNYRVPAEQIVENVLKLIKSDYETITVPQIEAYIHWATGQDAYFDDANSAEYHQRSLKEAQDFLEANA